MSLYIPHHVLKIIDLLEQNGASDVLLVGGCVRDGLLNIPSKDYDIEVYGLSYAQIRAILSPHFYVDVVGQSFGVLKVGRDVDVALPRRESKVGLGHKGFSVEATSALAPKEAFARRDFTINAIGMRRDGSFYDPFDGIGDLDRKLLRATSPAFKDDPLQILRGMQFSARFGFSTDSQTLRYCREVLPEFPTLPEERVYEEWKKWAIKGEHPELGLIFLRESGWIEAFPEIAALIDCPQNPEWHPEGDVWTHTLAVCKEAAKIARTYKPELTEEERLYILFSALAHDFGKPATTKLDENGILRSHKHDKVGSLIAREFFKKMKAPVRVFQTVEKLVNEHMTDINNPSVRAIQRLANRLAPANIKLWALLRQSDALGCGSPERHLAGDSGLGPLPREQAEKKIKFQMNFWLEAAERLQLKETAPRPLINGRDLIPLGIKPGPKMGKILKRAFEAQLDDCFSTIEDGLKYVQQAGWLK